MDAKPTLDGVKGSYLGNQGWNIGGALLSRAIEPVFLVLLARVLDPDAFGVYALVVAVRALYSVVKDLGLSVAIIVDRAGDDHRDLQLGVQLATAVGASGVLLFTASHIADWMDERLLAEVLPWLCLTFFLSAVEDPIVTHLRKRNAYRLLFWRRALPTAGFGVTAVLLASQGFGVMSLIWGHIAGQALNVVYLVGSAGRFPAPVLELRRLRRLLRLGGHVTVQSMLGYLSLQADALITGRLLGSNALGVYRMAQQLANIIPMSVLGYIQEVLVTDAAAGASRPGHLQLRYDQFLRLVPLSILFALTLYLTAPSLVPWLLGEQWTLLVEPLQLMTLTVVSSHLVAANNELGRIIGIAPLYTTFSLFRTVATLAAVWVGAMVSLDLLVVCWVGVTLASNYANGLLFQFSQSEVKVPGWLHLAFAGLLVVLVLETMQLLERAA
jgi:O-antigen/teichoic acid export membrane protein